MTELLRIEFVNFVEEGLGNLPLSVSMVGQMARSDPSINSTLDLISVFNKGKLNEAWVNTARNNMTDRHYFGLAMSIQITLERMESNEHFTLKERREAKELLCAVSRLDRTKVPLSLLTGNKLEGFVNREFPEGKFTNPSPIRAFPLNLSAIAAKS